jgi:hypothetical protein
MSMRCSFNTIESIFRRGTFRHFQSLPPMHRHNKMILNAINELRKNPIRITVSRQLSSFPKKGNQTRIQKPTFLKIECTVRQPRRVRLTTPQWTLYGPPRACDAGAQLAGTTKKRSTIYHNIIYHHRYGACPVVRTQHFGTEAEHDRLDPGSLNINEYI